MKSLLIIRSSAFSANAIPAFREMDSSRSTMAQQTSHLKVAYGHGSVLEHSRELALNHLSRPQFRALVDNQGFFPGCQRRPIDGLETTPGS